MTTNTHTTNTIRIDIDTNPESGKIVNRDLMAEIAARAFDWRLFVYDPEGEEADLADIIEQTEMRIDGMRDDIMMATGIPAADVIINRDCLDAMDFVFVVEYESKYVDTTSTYTGVVMISYVIVEDGS